MPMYTHQRISEFPNSINFRIGLLIQLESILHQHNRNRRGGGWQSKTQDSCKRIFCLTKKKKYTNNKKKKTYSALTCVFGSQWKVNMVSVFSFKNSNASYFKVYHLSYCLSKRHEKGTLICAAWIEFLKEIHGECIWGETIEANVVKHVSLRWCYESSHSANVGRLCHISSCLHTMPDDHKEASHVSLHIQTHLTIKK